MYKHTFNLFSFLLTRTVVISWSIKTFNVRNIAGRGAIAGAHHGFVPKKGMSHPLSDDGFKWKKYKTMN